MIDITKHLLEHQDRDWFAEGLRRGWRGDEFPCRVAWAQADEVQIATGLTGGVRTVLSSPEFQHKLGLGSVATYGITLYHSASVTHEGLAVNACPSAGDCRRLCVVENNYGQSPHVQKAWRWRTNMLVHHPHDFFVLLGQGLRKAVEANHGSILLRPDVNSDLAWHTFIPEMFDGSIFGDYITSYGYSKLPSTLTDSLRGQLTPYYKVAYSHNENSAEHVAEMTMFLEMGGAIAVVTDRRRGEKCTPSAVLKALPWAPKATKVVSADETDEWMFQHGPVIGDLALKPRTKDLRVFGEQSDFVVSAYRPRLF